MKYEAFIAEVTIVDQHDKIATLKHFDGDCYSVHLEHEITTPEGLEAIANTLRQVESIDFNLVDGNPLP